MISKKRKIGVGSAALVTAVAGLVTAVHGSRSTTTAITRNDTKPIVINRPHDANGSPLPVIVVQPSVGPPIVIVGQGAPEPCPSPSVTPTASATPSPAPSDEPECQ